jgi:hypothetical protein
MAFTQGDIAFISFNADEDSWSIVTFVDIDPNTIIYFTDVEDGLKLKTNLATDTGFVFV